MLKLYNTLTKKIEEVPKKDRLNLYTCGPTVYNHAHIGNMRSYIMADLVYRILKYEGKNPKWVMNITDIDDKTIRETINKYGPKATTDDLKTFTDFFTKEFLKDLKDSGVLVEEIHFVNVSDVIPEIQKFIIELVKRNFAYAAEDGIYFSIENYQKHFNNYGELVGEKFLEGKKIGARVAVDEYEKENLSDFALWKARNPETDGNIFWDDMVKDKQVNIVPGRPGWHIECSVINQIKFSGESTDIHTGGIDLIFPHHTNEIAQSECLYNPFVKFWYHCEHLQVDGAKMAKRNNNFYTIKDLQQKGFSGEDLRMFFLSANFKNQQNFTIQALESAHVAREKLLSFPNGEVHEKFFSSIADNLNYPEAIAEIFQTGKINESALDILGLGKLNQVEIPEKLQKLLDMRTKTKTDKDFQKADEIRKQIEEMGYEVMDTPKGQMVKRKISL